MRVSDRNKIVVKFPLWLKYNFVFGLFAWPTSITTPTRLSANNKNNNDIVYRGWGTTRHVIPQSRGKREKNRLFFLFPRVRVAIIRFWDHHMYILLCTRGPPRQGGSDFPYIHIYLYILKYYIYAHNCIIIITHAGCAVYAEKMGTFVNFLGRRCPNIIHSVSDYGHQGAL